MIVLPAVVAALLPLADATSVPAAAATALRASRHRSGPVIRIDASRRGVRVHPDILGVNHRWYRNGEGVWDVATNAPNRRVVRLARRAGISALRYPGGTVATMFDWKHAVGNPRGCQINAKAETSTGFSAAARAKAYGPSEFMQVARAIGSTPQIMVPFVNETPRDAADWVEYMNAPVGSNPNGGFDWASVRAADGHPAPYRVRLWEVGNEANVVPSRYGFSANVDRALHQYANGGVRHVRHESLGKGCAHPAGGVRSNGRRNQVFSTLYRPFQTAGFALAVSGHVWHRVSNLSNFGGRAHVYTIAPREGEVVFGDGHHGAIPPSGTIVRAGYTNRYSGYFRFARQMKAVDHRISVCASWGKPAFAAVARGRRYDCLSAHPITNFRGTGRDHWRNPLMGHDLMMLGLDRRREQINHLRHSLPAGTALWLTEFNAIRGDFKTFHAWSASMSHAVYMASMCAMLLQMGIPLGEGGDFINLRGEGAVLGSSPNYTFSADAVMREALAPMFAARGRVVYANVRRNPRRVVSGTSSYPGLSVAATRSGRRLWVLVINRLPRARVGTGLDISGFRSRPRALVRRVSSRRFTDWNRPGRTPTVRLYTRYRRVDATGFAASFPGHSITVYRLTRR